MKKTYITPAVLVMELKAENMLAMSAGKTDERLQGVDAWTNKKGWSADNFMPGNEDEYVEE